MRTAMLGALVGAGLAIAAVAATPDRSEVVAPRLVQHGLRQSGGELIALSATVENKYQQLTVIDPKLRVISVYHVDLASGDMELRCVRDIRWDLQMDYFNGKGLTPPEIRSMLESR